MIIALSSDSGLNVYAVIRDESGKEFNTSSSSFENYSSSNWGVYANTAAEQSGSGYYQVSIPAAITDGNYTATFYQRAGGSPAVGDPNLGSLNFTVATTPTINVPTNLITRLRILANDTSTSNRIVTETPSEAADGVNVNFRLQFKNVVVGSVFMSYGTTFRTQAGFTVDTVNGLITFTVAPANGTELKADYYYQWFTDTDYSEFLQDAAEHLSQTDPSSVPAGLVMALLQYALGYYWQRRASDYATRYSSSSLGVSAQADTVTKAFVTLADTAFKKADNFRNMFYKRQDQREAPASGIQTYGIDPYTPMR